MSEREREEPMCMPVKERERERMCMYMYVKGREKRHGVKEFWAIFNILMNIFLLFRWVVGAFHTIRDDGCLHLEILFDDDDYNMNLVTTRIQKIK